MEVTVMPNPASVEKQQCSYFVLFYGFGTKVEPNYWTN